MKQLLTLCALFGLVAATAACTPSVYENEPLGIGGGTTYLKVSPCACIQLDNPKTLPDWLKNRHTI